MRGCRVGGYGDFAVGLALVVFGPRSTCRGLRAEVRVGARGIRVAVNPGPLNSLVALIPPLKPPGLPGIVANVVKQRNLARATVHRAFRASVFWVWGLGFRVIGFRDFRFQLLLRTPSSPGPKP